MYDIRRWPGHGYPRSSVSQPLSGVPGSEERQWVCGAPIAETRVQTTHDASRRTHDATCGDGIAEIKVEKALSFEENAGV